MYHNCRILMFYLCYNISHWLTLYKTHLWHVQMETVATTQHQCVSDITSTTYWCGIMIRISRIWNVSYSKIPTPPMGVDMIFIDAKVCNFQNNPILQQWLFQVRILLILINYKQGQQIHATIPIPLLHVYNHILDVGKVYIVQHFVLSEAMHQHRPVPHAFRIFITLNTIVTPVLPVPQHFPRYRFYFLDYADIPRRLHDNTDLTGETNVTISFLALRLMCLGV